MMPPKSNPWLATLITASTKSSPATSPSTHKAENSEAPQVMAITDSVKKVQSDLSTLESSLASLNNDTIHRAGLDDTVVKNLIRFKNEPLTKQQHKHDVRVKEVQELLLESDAFEQMGIQIEEEVNLVVEEQVRQQVEDQLQMHLSDDYQNQIDADVSAIEQVQNALRNSENRRANALLNSSYMDGSLQPIFKSNGQVSHLYPKTLGELLGLDGDVAKRLVLEYELPDSDSRDTNLNTFMRHVGVLYTMVPTSAVSPGPKTSIPVRLDSCGRA